MEQQRYEDQRFKVPAEFLINLYHEDPELLNPTDDGADGREGTPSEIGGSSGGGGLGTSGRSPSPAISGILIGGGAVARKRKKAGGMLVHEAVGSLEERKLDIKLPTLEQAKRRKVVLEDEEAAAAKLKSERGAALTSKAEIGGALNRKADVGAALTRKVEMKREAVDGKW
jgi:hypothetical protein